jgi:hypothetical protein
MDIISWLNLKAFRTILIAGCMKLPKAQVCYALYVLHEYCLNSYVIW